MGENRVDWSKACPWFKVLEINGKAAPVLEIEGRVFLLQEIVPRYRGNGGCQWWYEELKDFEVDGGSQG